jgi:DNA-binding Lrp family transcriptional regulator
MKDIETRLVAELMKNSRRSDRELAKTLKVSQPTVTRTRQRLEKEGVIKEYTMVPDFQRLGYQIMAIMFFKLTHTLSQKEVEEMHRESLMMEKENPTKFLLAMRGIGMQEDAIVISLFRDYSEYARYVRSVREDAMKRLKPYVDAESIEGFLVNLEENTHYLPITFSRISANMLKTEDQDKD